MLERIAFEYRKDEPFRVVKDGCIGTIRTMEGGGVSKYIMEVKVIGQMDNTIDHTFESANRVYDKNGLAPTINTCGGGGLQPKVIDEVKELGFMDNGTVDMNPKLLGGIGEKWGDKQYRQGNRVYDANGVAMALTAQPLGNNGGNSYMYLTEEKSIVAMRGRNPENPSDRTVGAPTEQRLEPNSQGICNTLTSVTKDNLVMERKCISTKGKENDVASTILSGYERSNMTGFNADNGVLEEYYLSEKGKQYVCDPKRGMCTDINADVCQTLTAKGQSNWTGSFVSPDIDRLEKSTNIGSEEPTLIHLKDGRTITSNDCLTQYRIRKLTPRECGRLMGVDDEDIDKMLAVNSNSQAYKQYGNSIVKQCLIAIFSQMGIQGIPRWNEGLSEKYK